MRLRIGLLLVVVMAALSHPVALAQISYATVTATVTDPTGNPYANAAWRAQLVDKYGNGVSSATTPNGSLYTAVTPLTGNLSSAGILTANLPPNTILNGGTGTYWKINIGPPADPIILTDRSPTAWIIQYMATISGNVDLSSQISALAQRVNFVNLKTGQSTMGGVDPNACHTTGCSMTGALTLPGNPSASLQAAPKQYVDAAQANATDATARASAAAAQTTANAALPAAGGDTGTFSHSPNGMIDPRNALFGCKGDGTTDDTTCLTNWFQYSVTHRGPILYLPTPLNGGSPSCFYVNAPLNWGGFSGSVIVYGDGRDLMDTSSTALPSPICYGTGITSTQPVIDGSNHGTLIVDGISVYPKNGTLSAGACILVQPDNTGGTTSATVTHNNLQCGSGSSSEAVAVIASDVSTVTHNSIRSGGWGIVIGQQNGPSAVRSTFYTPVTGYGVTHVSALDNDVRTSYPPFEGTGNCGDYLIGDTAGTGYLVETSNVDTTHGGLDFSYTAGAGCQGLYLNLLDVNVESQGGGFPAAVVTGPVGSGNPYVTGGIWTGRLGGGTTTIAGNFEGVYATISGGNTAMSDSTNFVTGLLSDANHYAHLSPNAATGGFTGNISGSTIVGYHGDFNTPTTILGYLNMANQSNVRICSSGNPFGGTETCASSDVTLSNARVSPSGAITGTSASISGPVTTGSENTASLTTTALTTGGGFVSGTAENYDLYSLNLQGLPPCCGGQWNAVTGSYTTTTGQTNHDGSTTATEVQVTSAGSVIDTMQYTGGATALSNNTQYTIGVWLKGASGGEQVAISFGFVAAITQTLTTSWALYCNTQTTNTTNNSYTAVLSFPTTETVYFGGVSTQAGSQCGPVIPTTTTQVLSPTSINNIPTLTVTGLTAGTSPICPNGTGGQLTTSGCSGGGSGTFNALTGDATSTSTGGATTVKGLNNTLLSGLATGILKNTTATGVPSIAASSDIVALFTGTCSSSTYLRGDGSCQTPSGGSMTWPSGGPGIPNYNGSSAWGTSYSSTNAIPANFLPAALASSSSVNGTPIPASSTLPVKIVAFTIPMPTTSVASNSCDASSTLVSASGTVTAGAIANVASTDVVGVDFNSDPTAITGYNSGVFIMKYPESGDVAFKRCNNTASPITPGAATLNGKVTR